MGKASKGTGDMRQGTAAGVPYNWRRPTVERFKHTYWDTSTRRVFVPKFYGWGWDLNFGGLARRLHLVSVPPEST